MLAACVAGAFRLELALSVEDLLLENDPARVVYRSLRAHFDSDESLLVLARGDVFSSDFLDRLSDLHHTFEAGAPYVARVESLVNARLTRADGDTLVIDEWLDREPSDPAARRAWRDRALHDPAYRDLLVARDGETAALVVVLERPAAGSDDEAALAGFGAPAATTPERAGEDEASLLKPREIDRLMRRVDEIVAEHRDDGFELVVTGGPAMTDAVGRALERDMSAFTLGSILVIGALLFALFGRASGVLLPLTTSLVPMVATFGAMGWLDLPVTPATQLVPSLLIVVGVAQSVHLLMGFFRAHDAGMDRIDAIGAAFGESGVAVTMATFTTAGGLGSFVAASLEMLVGLGYAAAIGVLLVFTSGFVLLPALLAVVPIGRATRPSRVRSPLDRVLAGIGLHAVRHPWQITGAWACLIALALLGATSLQIRNDPLGWFPDDHPFVGGARLANESLGGVLPITIVIDSGRPGGLLEPETLRGIDEFERRARALEAGDLRAGASVSLAGIVKETHRALLGDRPEAYAVPDSREAVAQELLLFETADPDELENFVDDQFELARMTLMVPLVDNRAYLPFAKALQREADDVLPDVEVTLTGIPLLSARSNEVMMEGLIRSYGIALLLVAPLLIAAAGSWRVGLVGMIPNLAPIVLGLGLMFVLDVDFDCFTALIASIAIGIAVDDTIHFLHGWNRARDRLGSHELAVVHTLQTTGSALLTTSTALVAGFAVFTAAEMINVTHLGVVTSGVVAIALLADVQLCPALLSLMPLREREGRRPGDRVVAEGSLIS